VKVKRHEITCETDLKNLQDKMYALSKAGKEPFFDLIETMKSEEVILTAVHNIKANTGARTPGVDKLNIDDVLKDDFDKVVTKINKSSMIISLCQSVGSTFLSLGQQNCVL